MRRRPEGRVGGQGKSEWMARQALRQLMLPMISGVLATKEALFGLVQQSGLLVMREVFAEEAEKAAGPKGRHQANRGSNHWGSAPTEFPFAGRKVILKRPRVRAVDGREVLLPRIEELRQVDPVCERVIEQILLGVSTRGYGRSLERLPEGIRSRGTSKSAASRHVVERTGSRVEEFLARSLQDLDLAVLALDGLKVAKHCVVVALGIAVDGTKHPLGVWQGSTENGRICTELLSDLLARGLRVQGRLLCVIDGGKGLRKALDDVLGDAVVVQRCQVHKMRNLREHLPEKRHAYVIKTMRDAYGSSSAAAARKRLQALARWLESNGEESAARSLKEGLEETLTVIKLNLAPTLRRCLATTNCIENFIGTIRQVTRNVKRWRGGSMVRRWVGLAVAHAQKRFRRIKGYRDLPALVLNLRSDRLNNVDQETAVA
jgi:putative transposase